MELKTYKERKNDRMKKERSKVKTYKERKRETKKIQRKKEIQTNFFRKNLLFFHSKKQ